VAAWGRLGWNALAVDLDGMPLWQHGADLDGMPLQQTWMECPSGRLSGWNALAADLDGMLRRTWMGSAWGGLGWNALAVDLDGMP